MRRTRAPGFYGYGFGVGVSAAGRVELSHSGGFNLGAGTVFRLRALASGSASSCSATPSRSARSRRSALAFTDLAQRGAVVARLVRRCSSRVFAPMSAPAGRLAGAAPPTEPAPARPLGDYAGHYRNDYFGPVEVARRRATGSCCGPGPPASRFRSSTGRGDGFVFEPRGENAPDGSRSEVIFRGGPAGVAAVTVEILGRGRPRHLHAVSPVPQLIASKR